MKGTGLSSSLSPMGATASPATKGVFCPALQVRVASSLGRQSRFWSLPLYENMKDTEIEEKEGATAVVATPVSTTTASTAPALVTEKSLPSLPIMAPVKLPDLIPENQQREIFKWLLEEKRKVKLKNPEEKKRIDGEKAILKQFIRATSIPTF